MQQFEKLFNLKKLRNTTILMFIGSTIIVFLVNMIQVLEDKALSDINLLYFRDWIFFGEDKILSWLYYFSTILSFICALIFFHVAFQLKKIIKEKENVSNLRQMLLATSLYLGLGHVLEGLYLMLASDFKGAYEVIFQFYILLDTLSIVILMAIAFSIFLADKLMTNSKIAVYNFIFSMFLYFLGFIMMILYGLNPEGFSIGIIITIASLAILSLLAIVIILRIVSLKKKLEEQISALNFIGIQLILMVVSVFLLVGCGLTIGMDDLTLNRTLRLLRMVVLFLTAISYYPAYINPAKRKLKE
jgi:hypothetical protein